MAKLIFDFSKAGLGSMFQGDINRAISDPNLRYTMGDTDIADGLFNPFRRYGYISPANDSYKRITATGNRLEFGSVPRTMTEYTSLTTVETFMLAGERLWQGAGDDFTSLSSDSTDIHDGTRTWPLDSIMYYLEGTTNRLFFLTDTGGVSLGTLKAYNVGADTYADIKTSINVDEHSQLILADNGFLYLTMASTVDRFDGTAAGGSSGVYTGSVLSFPTSMRLRGGVDHRGKMFLGVVGFESGSQRDTSIRNNAITKMTTPRYVGVYIWDRLSSVTRIQDFVQIPNLQNLTGFHISPDLKVRVFGITNNRTTQLLEHDGSKFAVVKEMGPQAYPAQPKGVGVKGHFTYWLGQDGYFYCLGKTLATDKEEKLTKMLDLNAVARDISGDSTVSVTLAGAILPTAFYNTGQSNTDNRLDHDAVLIGFQYNGGIATTFTVTIASPGVFSSTAHGLIAGDSIKLSTTGALPTGLTAGTTYYVLSSGLTADTFQLSATAGGSAINTSGSQSGTHSFRRTISNEVIRYFPHTTETLQSVGTKAAVGNVYTPVRYLKRLSTVKSADFYCPPGGATGTTQVATIKFYFNQSTTPFKSEPVTRDDIAKGYIHVELNKPYVNAVQVEIEWATGQALGTNDFTPALCVLEYDDSESAI